jgi:hypothetical protein
MPVSSQAQWPGFVEIPSAMKSVFAGGDPSLASVRFAGMDAGDGGSCLRLKLALHYARTSLPAPWQRIKANSVSLELQCFGLQEISVSMQPGDSTVSCDISQDTTGNRVLRIVGPSIDLQIRCAFLRMGHLLPYAAEAPAWDA